MFDKGVERIFSVKTRWKSKNYRKLVRMRWTTNIISWLVQPYYYLKGKYIGWKLIKKYPDRWERYVATQEICEKKRIAAKRVENQVALNSELLMFRLCMLADVANRTGQTEKGLSGEDVSTILKGVEEYRSDILKILAEIVKSGGSGTEELERMVREVKTESFRTNEEFSAFVDVSDEALLKIQY